MTEQHKRTGRLNKNRGRAFERTVAETLGWTRVPYSGAMKEWGGADVVDGFYKKKGFWAAECKTHVVDGEKPANIHIKDKWVSQMLGGETNGRHGIIIIRRVRRGGLPGKRGPTPFVFMHEDTYDWFESKCPTKSFTPLLCSSRRTGKGHNFVVPSEWLGHCDEWMPLRIEVNDGPETVGVWYVFTLEDFKTWVHKYDIMEHDDAGQD